jgi:hypothetical protein
VRLIRCDVCLRELHSPPWVVGTIYFGTAFQRQFDCCPECEAELIERVRALLPEHLR